MGGTKVVAIGLWEVPIALNRMRSLSLVTLRGRVHSSWSGGVHTAQGFEALPWCILTNSLCFSGSADKPTWEPADTQKAESINFEKLETTLQLQRNGGA